MTRPDHPTGEAHDFTDVLTTDSRDRAVNSLLRLPALRRLWTAQLTGAVGDRLGVLVLLVLALQAAIAAAPFGGGYRGVAFAIAAVIAARLVAGLLFGAVLLGPLVALTSPPASPAPSPAGARADEGKRPGRGVQRPDGRPRRAVLDRRWAMIGADGVRLALFVIAPLWIDWVPASALAWLLVTAFVTGVAERVWHVAKDGAAPAMLPPAPLGMGAPRLVPDHLHALRRLDLRTEFVALPGAAAVLIAAGLVSNALGIGFVWFSLHQAALGSYVAAGLFAASIAVLYFIELPDGPALARPRSPLEGLPLPRGREGAERGRTGALPILVLACAAVAGAIAWAVAVAVLEAADLGGGSVEFGLLVAALTGGTVLGIRTATGVLPGFPRRRLLGLAIAVQGLALLIAGLVSDATTVLLLAVLTGYAAGVAANTGHTLIDQEAEEPLRPRTTEHLHAVARVAVAVAAVGAPLVAGGIGRHRLVGGAFTFDHGGAAYTLMLVGALLLPVAALVLGRLDDREVPLRQDLREALRGGEPRQASASGGFFLAIEGGDGAGKSTQVETIAEWIRAKGHEVVITREPGATAIGKRLRSILLDVASSGISHRAEALLYAADRAEHVDSVVRPGLERGAVVISDRYVDSSVAYQGAGRDLEPTEIARISRWATGGLIPHLTVLLDISPGAARERFTEAPDRLESEPAAFHERVRRGFLALAAADPSRYLVIDAAQEPETITRIIRHRLDQLLPLSEKEIEARAEAERRAAEEARRRAEEEAARKAEEERLERERQEQLAQLRAEEEERERLAEEERRREEEERQAAEARRRAQEARRLAEEERARREAEARAHAEEQARLRRLKEEQDRLRAEAEERRVEKQRRAEEALLRAEEARLEEAAAASGAGGTGGATTEGPAADDETQTIETPHVRPPQSGPSQDDAPELREPRRPEDTTLADTTLANVSHTDVSHTDVSHTDVSHTDVSHTDVSHTEVTRTMEVPRLPTDAEETAVLPSVRLAQEAPADRVPSWLFRTEDSEGGHGGPAESPIEITRELPQVEDSRQSGENLGGVRAGTSRGKPRPRPSWAEETPLDDLPSLADELLGPREEYESPEPYDDAPDPGPGEGRGRGH